MKKTTPEPLFPLGVVVATPGALQLLRTNGFSPSAFLERHVRGDWGGVSAADSRANDEAVLEGNRLLSSYLMPNGELMWVITEADRSATTLLLPAEY